MSRILNTPISDTIRLEFVWERKKSLKDVLSEVEEMALAVANSDENVVGKSSFIFVAKGSSLSEAPRRQEDFVGEVCVWMFVNYDSSKKTGLSSIDLSISKIGIHDPIREGGLLENLISEIGNASVRSVDIIGNYTANSDLDDFDALREKLNCIVEGDAKPGLLDQNFKVKASSSNSGAFGRFISQYIDLSCSTKFSAELEIDPSKFDGEKYKFEKSLISDKKIKRLVARVEVDESAFHVYTNYDPKTENVDVEYKSMRMHGENSDTLDAIFKEILG